MDGQHPIAFLEMFSRFSVHCQYKKSKRICHSPIVLFLLYIFSLHLLHSPSTRCLSANSINGRPLYMLHRYVTCFAKLRLLQTNSKCNMHLCLFTLQYYVLIINLSGNVIINTNFGIKWRFWSPRDTKKCCMNIFFFITWRQWLMSFNSSNFSRTALRVYTSFGVQKLYHKLWHIVMRLYTYTKFQKCWTVCWTVPVSVERPIFFRQRLPTVSCSYRLLLR